MRHLSRSVLLRIFALLNILSKSFALRDWKFDNTALGLRYHLSTRFGVYLIPWMLLEVLGGLKHILCSN